MGLDTRSASVKVGQQGRWGLNLYCDRMIDAYSKSFRSAWNQDGAWVPGVLPGSVKNAQTPTPLLRIQDICSRRDIFGGGGKLHAGDWTIETKLRQKHRDGCNQTSRKQFIS